MDGTPDDSIPLEEQVWATDRLNEYWYRTHFHLSKEEMAKEPAEDFYINIQIHKLIQKKQQIDSKMLEQKLKNK